MKIRISDIIAEIVLTVMLGLTYISHPVAWWVWILIWLGESVSLWLIVYYMRNISEWKARKRDRIHNAELLSYNIVRCTTNEMKKILREIEAEEFSKKEKMRVLVDDVITNEMKDWIVKHRYDIVEIV